MTDTIEFRPQINVTLLKRVMQQIHDRPELWEQGSWAIEARAHLNSLLSNQHRRRHKGVTKKQVAATLKEVDTGKTCNTAFCAAGWAVALSGLRVDISAERVILEQTDMDDPDNSWTELGPTVEVSARMMLGLTSTEADEFFNGGNTMQALDAISDRLIKEQAARDRAAKRRARS